MISNGLACWAWCGWVGPGVHLELLEHLAAELVLGEHAPDGLLDDLAGVLVQLLADRRRGETAGVAGVAVHQLVGQLVAGERDLLRVDDDDEVTGVHVRGEGRLVLAAQQVRGLDGELAEDDVGGVDDVPLALDVAGLRAVRTHVRLPLLVRGTRNGPAGARPRVGTEPPRPLTNTARLVESSGSAPHPVTQARPTAGAAGVATAQSTGAAVTRLHARSRSVHRIRPGRLGNRIRSPPDPALGWSGERLAHRPGQPHRPGVRRTDRARHDQGRGSRQDQGQ